MKKKMVETNRFWQKTAVVVFWLLVWQGLSLLVKPSFLVAGPVETLRTLIMLCTKEVALFFTTIGHSFGNILMGFWIAVIGSVVLAGIAWRYSFAALLLQPLERIMKSIPVASCVIILLLWVGSEKLSLVLTVMVAFPVLYTGLLTALGQVDKELLEMADCFRMKRWRRICVIYLPGVAPGFLSGMTTAYGMSFRAGIAAELIAVPAKTIGEQLYYAKIYLDTAQVFAWTVAMLLVCFLTERVILWVMHGIIKRVSKAAKGGDRR